ncbi:hypothetical protein D3C77_501380 [compost metagenome]
MRRLEQQLGVDAHRRSLLYIRPEGCQRLACLPRDADMYRKHPVRLVRLERLAQSFIQRWIARLPNPVADVNLAQIDVIPSRNDIDDPFLVRFAFQLHTFAAQIVDTSAFFFFRRISSVKDDPVSALHRSLQAA